MRLPTIQKKQFTLRPFRMSDVDAVVAYAKDARVARYTANIPHPYTKKDAMTWIKKNITEYRSRQQDALTFAIEIDGKAAGAIGLHHKEYGRYEVGYALGVDYWNRGVMTQALKEVLRWAFAHLDTKRIQGTVFVKNEASARVMEKAGMHYEGTLRKYLKKGNDYKDVYMFAKVK